MELIVHYVEAPFIHFSNEAKKILAIGLFAFAFYGLYNIAIVIGSIA